MDIEFIIQFSEIKFFQFSNQKQFENSFFNWITIFGLMTSIKKQFF